MSKKVQLKSLIQQYKAEGDSISKKINELKKSNNFTEDYKKQLIQNEIQKLNAVGQEIKEKASLILNEKIADISKGARTNTQDSNYQLGLANALKLLELGAAELNNNDIKALLEPFAGDRIATAAFKGALTNAGKDNVEILAMLPKDERAHNIKILENMNTNIKEYFNPSREWEGLTGVGMAVAGMEQSLDTLLDDDLSYVQNAPQETTFTAYEK
ncbi:hypothetical protein HMPREF1982_02683 [Clostridiales bacterium oral taxon 876 str. F0540]|nr:hypothetical protein HMPREF1982_02683 [Clostridiales bacterium oral taxon 876 str. F0540]